MKAFITSIALAEANAFVSTTVKTVNISTATTESPIAYASGTPGLSVTWFTQKTETDAETT